MILLPLKATVVEISQLHSGLLGQIRAAGELPQRATGCTEPLEALPSDPGSWESSQPAQSGTSCSDYLEVDLEEILRRPGTHIPNAQTHPLKERKPPSGKTETSQTGEWKASPPEPSAWTPEGDPGPGEGEIEQARPCPTEPAEREKAGPTAIVMQTRCTTAIPRPHSEHSLEQWLKRVLKDVFSTCARN